MSSDDEAIRALLTTLEAAWERGDGAGFASVFAEDADFTSLRHARSHSRADIAAAHDRLFSTVYRGTQFEAEVEKIRYLRPDIAILDIAGQLSGRGVGPDGKSAGSHMYALAVVERRPEGWEIVALQNMLPLGGGPPARGFWKRERRSPLLFRAARGRDDRSCFGALAGLDEAARSYARASKVSRSIRRT